MNIHFEMVRIGDFRKNRLLEKIIRENVNILQLNLRKFLENETDINKSSIELTMVIPSRGTKITFVLNDIKDDTLKSKLRLNFPDSIFNGDENLIYSNLFTPIFRGFRV